MHTIYSDTQYTNESKHSEMGPVRQNPIHRTVRSVHTCVQFTVYTIVAHNAAQNRPDNFPSYPPDKHHCSMMSICGKGGETEETKPNTIKTNNRGPKWQKYTKANLHLNSEPKLTVKFTNFSHMCVRIITHNCIRTQQNTGQF